MLHFEPAYRHARHYLGWARDVDARVAEHLASDGTARRVVQSGVWELVTIDDPDSE